MGVIARAASRKDRLVLLVPSTPSSPARGLGTAVRVLHEHAAHFVAAGGRSDAAGSFSCWLSKSRGRRLRPTHPRLCAERTGFGPPSPLPATLASPGRVDRVLQDLYFLYVALAWRRRLSFGEASRCGGLALLVRGCAAADQLVGRADASAQAEARADQAHLRSGRLCPLPRRS